jgi:hypothetical protein
MSEPSAAFVRESRERRPLHVPPLLVPGERASYLFGIGGGCLPMLAGVAAWLLFWFGGDEPPTGMRKWGTLGFSSVLFLMGLRFAMETFWPPSRRLRRPDGAGPDSAPEPWGEGYPWQREMPPYDAGTGPGKIVAAFVGLTAFLVVINFPLFDHQTDTLLWALILFFDALLLFVLGAVLREVLGRLNTGSVRLHLDTYPATPGGHLRATLVSRRPLPLAKPVTAVLSCAEEVEGVTGPIRDPDRTGRVEAFYTQEQTVQPPARRTQRLALDFPLPADLPATRVSLTAGPRRYWILELTLPLPGPDGHLFFLVPVYA